MKKLGILGAVALLAVGVSVAFAADLESGLQPGDSVGAFTVEKVAGNPHDNVEVGKNLCYRCMLGSKPVVMVFARKPNKPLASLIKKLDAELPQHADQKLSSFVNIIGSDDPDTLKSSAKKFGDEIATENIAIVVPDDSENGPKEFKISPEAEVTVILYRNGKVEANHAFAPGKLDDKGIASVIADTAKIVN
jgi:hypothetical protein